MKSAGKFFLVVYFPDSDLILMGSNPSCGTLAKVILEMKFRVLLLIWMSDQRLKTPLASECSPMKKLKCRCNVARVSVGILHNWCLSYGRTTRIKKRDWMSLHIVR